MQMLVRLSPKLVPLSLSALLVLTATPGPAQNSASTATPPVTFTTEQDRQNMMDQLGIQALRPGPSGDEKAPNHANYDESAANPYTNVPDPLRLNNGEKVTTPQMWWGVRRPQIVHDYEQYVYGRLPKNIPKVTWSVLASEKEQVGFHPVVATDLIGQVDNSAYPLISVNLRMTVVLPADVKGPVPVLIMFDPAGFPSPVQPSFEELARLNTAMKALLVQQDPSLKDVIAGHPGWNPVRPVPFEF